MARQYERGAVVNARAELEHGLAAQIDAKRLNHRDILLADPHSVFNVGCDARRRSVELAEVDWQRRIPGPRLTPYGPTQRAVGAQSEIDCARKSG